MDFSRLNPYIRSVGVYEVINNSGECRAYDSRLIYMISGDISVSIEGEKAFHLSVGNLLFIPAGMRYKLKGQYLRAAVITFDPTDAWCDVTEKIPPSSPETFRDEECHRGDFSPFDRMLLLEDAESSRDSFIKMEDIAASGEGEWRAEISAMLKLELINLAASVSCDALPPQMAHALDAYIRENCDEEISNTEIGATFGYHPFYVSRLLKEKKGVTMRQYIIAYRLKLSKRMLELTKMSIAEIAERCGFTDASYFTKTFRQAFGMTPKEWRNKFKEDFI